jgi:hypothetical protein
MPGELAMSEPGYLLFLAISPSNLESSWPRWLCQPGTRDSGLDYLFCVSGLIRPGDEFVAVGQFGRRLPNPKEDN